MEGTVVGDMDRFATKQQTTGGGGDLGQETAGSGDLEFEPAAPGGLSGKKRTGLLLLLVVGLAIGSMFSMRTLTKVSGGAKGNAKMETIVDDFLASIGSASKTQGDDPATQSIEGYKDVVHVLTDNYTRGQLKDLGRNPFSSYGEGEKPIVAAPTGNQCDRAADKLVLKSVMGGSIANINGRVVRVGQVFPVDLDKGGGQVDFRLKEVGTDSVTVECVGDGTETPVERTLFLRRK